MKKQLTFLLTTTFLAFSPTFAADRDTFGFEGSTTPSSAQREAPDLKAALLQSRIVDFNANLAYLKATYPHVDSCKLEPNVEAAFLQYAHALIAAENYAQIDSGTVSHAYGEFKRKNEIIEAIKAGHEDEVCAKLEAFTDVSLLSQYQVTQEKHCKTEQTILHLIIQKGLWSALKILGEKGGDLTTPRRTIPDNDDSFTRTPLEYLLACHFFEGDVIEVFQLLAEKGNSFYNDGQSILIPFFAKTNRVKSIPKEIQLTRNICEAMGKNIFIQHLIHGRDIVFKRVNSAKIQSFLCTEYILSAIREGQITNQKGLFDLFMFYIQMTQDCNANTRSDFLDWDDDIRQIFHTALDVTAEIQKLHRSGFFRAKITIPTPEIQTNTLSGFPTKEMWRLFVSGEMQNRPPEYSNVGWMVCENEERLTIPNILNAFEWSRTQAPLSFDIYAEIHRRACQHFTSRKDMVTPNTKRACIRNGVIVNADLNINGFFELRSEKYTQYKKMYFVENFKFLGRETVAFFDFENIPTGHSFVEKIIADYIAQINHPYAAREDKLKAIIMVASDLLRFHMYADGNTRTAAIILQRELIRNNFSPVILKNMDRFDGFSQEDLLREVYKGMIRFDYVKTHGNYPGATDDCTTDAICTRIKKTTPGMWMPI